MTEDAEMAGTLAKASLRAMAESGYTHGMGEAANLRAIPMPTLEARVFRAWRAADPAAELADQRRKADLLAIFDADCLVRSPMQLFPLVAKELNK